MAHLREEPPPFGVHLFAPFWNLEAVVGSCHPSPLFSQAPVKTPRPCVIVMNAC
ncbi:allophanate hydrolase [Sesbania bispinosa]|nr:allophanate hydrolase [Sesbania bispinosa]